MIVVDGFPFVERCFEVQFSVFVLALSDEEGSELDGDSSSLGGGDEPVLSVCVFVANASSVSKKIFGNLKSEAIKS